MATRECLPARFRSLVLGDLLGCALAIVGPNAWLLVIEVAFVALFYAVWGTQMLLGTLLAGVTGLLVTVLSFSSEQGKWTFQSILRVNQAVSTAMRSTFYPGRGSGWLRLPRPEQCGDGDRKGDAGVILECNHDEQINLEYNEIA